MQGRAVNKVNPPWEGRDNWSPAKGLVCGLAEGQ